MTQSQSRSNEPLHPTIDAMLGDFVLLGDRMGLPEAKLRQWAERIDTHPQRRDIGRQLIAVAARFVANNLTVAAQQAAALATVALGPQRVREGLGAAGVDADAARQLVDLAHNGPRPPTEGLARPGSTSRSGKATGPIGASLRKPKG